MKVFGLFNASKSKRIWLQKKEVASLKWRSAVIECVRGRLWITSAEGREQTLIGGQSMLATSKGKICITALSASEVNIIKECGL